MNLDRFWANVIPEPNSGCWTARSFCDEGFNHAEGRSGMTYEAATSAEKARAMRLEAKGLVRISRERDSRVLRINGKNRLVGREIFYVEPTEANK